MTMEEVVHLISIILVTKSPNPSLYTSKDVNHTSTYIFKDLYFGQRLELRVKIIWKRSNTLWNLVVQIDWSCKQSWLTNRKHSYLLSFFLVLLYKKVKKNRERCMWVFWTTEQKWEDIKVWVFFIVL